MIASVISFLEQRFAIFLAAILGAISLAGPTFWFLAPLALAAFFYDIWCMVPDVHSAFRHAAFFGLVTAAAAMNWWWSVYPFDWAGIPTANGFYAIAIAWTIVVFTLAVPIGVVGIITYYTRSFWFAPLLAPVLWTLGEYGRMWAFAVLVYGKGSALGAHFSMVAVGYTLAENPYFLQLAYPYGIWGLSFAVALAGSLFATAVVVVARRMWYTCFALVGGLCLAALFAPFFEISTVDGSHALRVAILSLSRRTDLGSNATTTDSALLLNAATSHPDVIIMPEGYSLTDLVASSSRKSFFEKSFGARDVLIMSSEDNGGGNVLYYDTPKGTIATYRKIFLTPIGEYQPFWVASFFDSIGDSTVRRFFTDRPRLLPGQQLVAVDYRGIKIGGLLCSESLSPVFSRELANRHGATVIVNLADPVSFHSSRALFAKELEIAKVHAVESRVYFLESNASSASFIINPRGTIVAQSPWNQDDVTSAIIAPN